MNALQIAARIRAGEVSAAQVVEETLADIARRNPAINAFTQVTAQRARTEAANIDRLRAGGKALPPLAGVPYAVKDLFDVAGLPTTAGSAINKSSPPASSDAVLVARMREAGAVLVGTLNMDAYAYGFTTENTAFGPTHNPHDLTRIAGGSSGGSGAAVAAGMVPLALGSDTNGSIRVPASLCGLFGLKPTYGRLPRTGTYPFVSSFDHLGPFAQTTADLAACYDAMQGADAGDTGCAERAVEPVSGLLKNTTPFRVARLAGYFDRYASDEARAAAMLVAKALGAKQEVELPEPHRARAAAFIIAASEGGARHLETLKRQYEQFEPMSRDRLVAGALTPASWYLQAQRFRSWFREKTAELFSHYDLLIAPATPVSATPIGTEWMELGGEKMPLRASMGLLTQPISFIGLPVVCVPVAGPGLPLGVQLIAAPWREDLCFAAAAALEKAGVAKARIAQG
jgi:AtzE family amidohydrolase